MTRGIAATAIFAALSGCALQASPPATRLDGEQSWSAVIGPLVIQRCGSCHRAGDIGPFPLETYAQVMAMKPAVVAAVREKRMPPFPPLQTDESGCPQLDDVRRMTEDERAVLLAWLEAESPAQGDAVELPAAKPFQPLGPPSDIFKMPQAYDSLAEGEDDYRCFPVDPVLLTSYPVAAISVLPGNRNVMHHGAVYLVPPGGDAQVRKLDDADPGPGYRCFGGVGTTAVPAGVWVPGNDAPLVPTHTGLGYYLPVGWTFVLQNHYNYAGGKGSDQSSIVLWKMQSPIITEVPRAMIAGDMDFEIPPGAVGFSTEAFSTFLPLAGSSDNDWDAVEGKVYAVWAHQHRRGRSVELDLVRPDGSEQCLLRIPKWNFDWQSIYRLKTPLPAKAGDKLRVRCTWDNAEPGAMPVRYGEDTNDEMCFGSLALIN